MAARKPGVRALVFDVFGTVVDWRSSIIREGRALGRRKRLRVDWVAFADAWRDGYQPPGAGALREVGWTRIDDLHRMILDGLLKQFSIRGLAERESTT
jgi:2-haloacid dehalogenase